MTKIGRNVLVWGSLSIKLQLRWPKSLLENPLKGWYEG